MTSTSQQHRAKQRSLLKAVAVLSVVLFLALVVLATVAWQRHGATGVLAAGLATAVCWAASIAALCLICQTTGTPGALNGVLGGILLRTGLPMGFAIAGSGAVPPLAEAGLLGMTMLMFLLSLAVETLLAVGIVTASRAGENCTGTAHDGQPGLSQAVVIQD